jgi:hypothetical protein
VQCDTAALAAALCDAQSQRCQLLQSQQQHQQQQQQQQSQQSLLPPHSSSSPRQQQQQQQSVVTERALAGAVQRLSGATQRLQAMHTVAEIVDSSDPELHELVLATKSAQVSCAAIKEHMTVCTKKNA